MALEVREVEKERKRDNVNSERNEKVQKQNPMEGSKPATQ